MSRVWLGAGYALGRTVPVDEPYPHLCGVTVVGRTTGQRIRLWKRDCAACTQQEHDERRVDVGQLPPVDPDITAAEARRLGEHD